MRYLKTTLIIALLGQSTTTLAATPEGSTLYQQYCGVCHDSGYAKPRVAPPMDGVISHYRARYPDSKELANAIATWAKNPSADKTLLPMAIRVFGLMPNPNMPPSYIDSIADYLAHRGDIMNPRQRIPSR